MGEPRFETDDLHDLSDDEEDDERERSRAECCGLCDGHCDTEVPAVWTDDFMTVDSSEAVTLGCGVPCWPRDISVCRFVSS